MSTLRLPDAPATAGSAAPPAALAGLQPGTTAVLTEDVPLRTAPQVDAPVVAEFPRGTAVLIIAAAQGDGAVVWWPGQAPTRGVIGFVPEEDLASQV